MAVKFVSRDFSGKRNRADDKDTLKAHPSRPFRCSRLSPYPRSVNFPLCCLRSMVIAGGSQTRPYENLQALIGQQIVRRIKR